MASKLKRDRGTCLFCFLLCPQYIIHITWYMVENKYFGGREAGRMKRCKGGHGNSPQSG